MLNRNTHITMLSVIIRVMNTVNQPCQSFVPCQCRFRDWSCKLLHGPQDVWSSNSCRTQAFQNNVRTNFGNFSIWFQFLLFELMIIQTRMRNFVKLLHFFVCQLTVSFKAFLSMSFHDVGPRYCLCKFLRPRYFSVAPAEMCFKHPCWLLNNCFVWFAFPLSASQVYVVKKWCGFADVHMFHQFHPHGSHILLLSCHFHVIHIYWQK